MKLRFVAAAVISLIASNVLAASPYAGEEERDIKALSAEDVDAYLTGQGMGFAKAAELNGYAGPKHVLELASELELTAEQRTRTQALFASMQTKAVALGRQLVDEERKLDRLVREHQHYSRIPCRSPWRGSVRCRRTCAPPTSKRTWSRRRS